MACGHCATANGFRFVWSQKHKLHLCEICNLYAQQYERLPDPLQHKRRRYCKSAPRGLTPRPTSPKLVQLPWEEAKVENPRELLAVPAMQWLETAGGEVIDKYFFDKVPMARPRPEFTNFEVCETERVLYKGAIRTLYHCISRQESV